MQIFTWPATIHLPDPGATTRLGKGLAGILRPGDVVALSGDLGAGKTSLARSIIQSLSGKDEAVPSPTFTLLQQYSSPRGMLWHFDFYRLKNAADVIDLGFEEALSDIVLVEWPERAASYLPQTALRGALTSTGDGGRTIILSGDAGWKARFTGLF